MKACLSVVVALGLVAWTAPARAFNWSVGANLGFNIVAAVDKDLDGDGLDDLENTTHFGWPTSGVALDGNVPGDVFGLSGPGLRIGFTGENPTHEVYLDSGLQYSGTSGGLTYRSFVATANYQYNFAMTGPAAPFVTAGGGFIMGGFKDQRDPDDVIDLSATSAVFGGGVGIRHRLGHGKGTLRGEVRFDRTSEGNDGDNIMILATNNFGVRVGFDLWGK